MKFTAYEISPIDAGWDFLPTVQEFATKVAALEMSAEAGIMKNEPLFTLEELKQDFVKARKLAVDAGWDEGDYSGSGEPRIILLPTPSNAVAYGFVWKQENNGDTFVISPYKLDYLKAWATKIVSEG